MARKLKTRFSTTTQYSYRPKQKEQTVKQSQEHVFNPHKHFQVTQIFFPLASVLRLLLPLLLPGHQLQDQTQSLKPLENLVFIDIQWFISHLAASMCRRTPAACDITVECSQRCNKDTSVRGETGLELSTRGQKNTAFQPGVKLLFKATGHITYSHVSAMHLTCDKLSKS